ncbi:hypothetical protein BO71DRAFT_119934 [Aspergillus ellipticus CBS 707.79]|uniref:Uncharacterized protein n=1 Tax=Aspergillus ellipticus CBS 707.79 TaxID=1448320 RepID=A0A319CV28_9EURO|nr:hypothetical protein BO71DRAFT_119934 [Aspergillus ellipticus CBS 707.79]
MPPLTTVIAIAVSCAVIFIVSAIVATVIWIRVRQDRLSLAVTNAKNGRFALQYHAETLTELSREEGTALRQYGQLPYGKPSEWGVLSSRESLATQSPVDSEVSSPLIEKVRDVRRSLSRSLSARSGRGSRNFLGPQRFSSLSPLTERSEKRTSYGSPTISCIDEGVMSSAVEGAFELPTETTPRHTPDREEDQMRAEITMRPVSGGWPLMHHRERSGNLYPLMEDNHEGFHPPYTRVRGGSITAQTAGTAPEQPVPPPPCAYPPNRFRLSKNDSICLSSLSLETADSSILDDSRRTSTNIDSDFTSPALPPCPMFAPFDANDVGRMEFDRRSFVTPSSVVPAPFIFPASSCAVWDGQRIEPGGTSPRRSLTARSPSHSMERISPPPRRSESLSEHKSKRDSSLWVKPLDLNRAPPLNAVGHNVGLLPYFSQMQRHSMHDQRNQDPFYSDAGNSMTINGQPRKRATIQEGPMQISTLHPRPPLPSALKGGHGSRRGHRRQNCVRISIHPPITFGSSGFSPTAEEPEPEEIDGRRSRISGFSASHISLDSSMSSFSMGMNSFQNLNTQPRITEIPSEEPRNPYRGPPRKRRYVPTDPSLTNMDKVLPEVVTTLPPPKIDTSLTSTPSSEKNSPVWMIPNYNKSPTTHENETSPGSPRRSVVKGPRFPPAKSAARNSQRPLEDSAKSPSSPPGRFSRPLSTRREPARRHNGKELALSQPSRQLSRRNTQQRPPSAAVPKPPRANSGIIVPIWEDKTLDRKATIRSSVSMTSEPAELQGESSPTRTQRSKSQGSPPKSTCRGRQEFKTPTKKTVGLGIGAATPASLYDGDGFLKE